MTRKEILVYRNGDDWCVRCDGALFERMACAGDALRVARSHAVAAERAGLSPEIRLHNDRRPH